MQLVIEVARDAGWIASVSQPLGRYFCSNFSVARARRARRWCTDCAVLSHYGRTRCCLDNFYSLEASQSAGTARPARHRSRMALRLLALATAAAALDRPTSRFQNAFGNRGSSVRRKRTLPVYRPPDSPATPLPVPGSSRTLRYQPEGAANAQLVRDLQQYGALVVVIGDGEDEPIGCVVDVRLAEVLNRRPYVFASGGVSWREGAGWSLFRI